MIDVLLGVLGALLVVGTLVEALVTTVSVGSGPGPVSRRFARVVWRGVVRLRRRDRFRAALRFSGPAVLLVVVLAWVIALWAGWTLVLVAGDAPVVESSTGRAAGLVDVAYYAGFTVFTLGVGDFVAADPAWRLLTAVASFTGLALVTLAITYLISVVQAVVARRALAVRVHALGDTPARVVLAGWDGSGWSDAFVQHLVDLTAMIATLGEQHLAYPVLRYFGSSERTTSAPVALAVLSDAALLLQSAVEPAGAPPPATVRPLREVLDRYVATAARGGGEERDTPPLPDLAPLATAGVPVVDGDELAARAAGSSGPRGDLARLVTEDGWDWPTA